MSQIYFKEYGNGEPLVFLHGFCETHAIWEEIANSLGKEYRVLYPDLPGFGKSPQLAPSFSLNDIGNAIVQWLQSLSIQKCFIFGHSLGGYITLEIARQHPAILHGLCLFNSTAYPDGPDKKENRNKLIAHLRENGVSAFIRTFVPSLFYPERVGEFEGQIKRITENGLKLSAAAVAAYAAAMRDRPDGTAVLKANKSNTLIIAGENDQNVPREVSMNMKALIDERHFHLLPASAHMSMYEQKDKVLEIIRGFIEKVGNYSVGSLN